MKKTYEVPSLEITFVGTNEDILVASENEVLLDIGDLWSF